MEFTHFNKDGYAKMVDVTEKESTCRCAVAEGSIYMNKQTVKAILDGEVKKGDVLSVAQVDQIKLSSRGKYRLLIQNCKISEEKDNE